MSKTIRKVPANAKRSIETLGMILTRKGGKMKDKREKRSADRTRKIIAEWE